MPLIDGTEKDKVIVQYLVNVPARNVLPVLQQRIGVGEKVRLSLRRPIPGAVWSMKGAHRSTLVIESPGVVVFDAADVPVEGQTGYRASLELTAAGRTVARVIVEVVRPLEGRCHWLADIHKKQAGVGDRVAPNRPNAGFRAHMYLLPADVSFMNVVFREGNGTNQADGAFSNYNNNDHPERPGDFAQPKQVTMWGTQYDCVDTVFSAADEWGCGLPPKWTGSTTTPIKWRYKIKNAAGEGKVLGEVVHKATVTQAGRLTISKGGASVSKELGDPATESW